MKFKLSVNKAGYIYLPKRLKEMLGIGDVEALENAKTIVVYKAGEDLTNISKSLDVIQKDIELRQSSSPKNNFEELLIFDEPFLIETDDDTGMLIFRSGSHEAKGEMNKIKEAIEKRGLDAVCKGIQTGLITNSGFPRIPLEKIKTELSKIKVTK